MTATLELSPEESMAMRLAADLFHHALLEAAVPVKASEAARLVGRSDVDLRLARVVLASNPSRFTSTDRRWTVRSRFGNATRTVERTMDDVMELCGLPMSLRALAREVAAIYDRPVDVFESTLARMLANPERYFCAGGDRYGRACWLLDTTSDSPDDVLFDNFLSEDDVAPYVDIAGGIKAGDIESLLAFLDRAECPVPSKVLQFLVWQARPDRFDGATLFSSLLQDGRAACLSGREWIGPRLVSRSLTCFTRIAEQEVEEHADTSPTEAPQPLVITDEEREQLVDFVLRNETVSRVPRMLEDIFEVTEGEPTFEVDRVSIQQCLSDDPRVVWVGSDRFLPQGAIPDYVFSVPGSLAYPEVHYTDLEGNEVDMLLEDDGLSGGLANEIMATIAQDVLDEEPVVAPPGEPPVTVRCVLKLHHKSIGTFPICQMPPGFFPAASDVVQVEVALPNGHKAEAWVNQKTRLMYGLLDWFDTLPIDSGAVFYVERQAPDQYVLTYGEETEPALFVSRNRVNELVELGMQADQEELPTFEILRQIMEHYRKGIEFITVLTELNIARRVPRRMVASLLSGYHCFFQRGKAWVYDARRLSQGFDKSKRKYLHK